MFKKIDYSKLTLQELLIEEASYKKIRKVLIAFTIIGLLVTLFSIYKRDSGFLNAIFPIIMILTLIKNGETMKTIIKEIKTREKY